MLVGSDQSVAVISLRKGLNLGSTSSAPDEHLAISLAKNICFHIFAQGPELR